MKIAFVASEAVPYAKTGGLADVAGALPAALTNLGNEVKLFIPKYSSIEEEKFNLRYCWDIGEMQIKIGDTLRSVHLHTAKLPGADVDVYFIDCPFYFFRKQIYTDDPDEDQRFILFSKAVLEVIRILKWAPDIIHCNDWPTGLIPLYLKDNYSSEEIFKKTATLFTIHNIGYQGLFDSTTLIYADIKEDYFFPGGPVEYFGSISFMKTAIYFSDIINTVSKTYAMEILTPAYGAGMEGILNHRKQDVFGILNGVDYDHWDPSADRLIPYKYSIEDMSGKQRNKEFLCDHFKLQCEVDIPLIGIVSRMAGQKGFDLIASAADQLMELHAQWIVLGNGEEKYENLFRYLAAFYPGKVSTYIGFNTELSHLIEAGADIFLMPSQYEPCGLNQIYSLKYGTVPVVRKTGGLADTVKDWDESVRNGKENGNGFTFNKYTGTAMYDALQRAVKTFDNKPVWHKIQQNGMKDIFSWEYSAKEYVSLYNKAYDKINPGLLE
jgi:starch synthase